MSDKPEITNEMKAECMGEFEISYEDICPKCFLGDDSPCMCNSDHNGVFTNARAIPWDLCKQIYKKMYSLSPEAKEIAALKARVAELEAGNEKRDLIIEAQGVERFFDWMQDQGFFGTRPCMAYDEYILRLQNKIHDDE